MTKQLDARETVFISEYLISLDPKAAALKAGYSPSMAKSKAYQWVSDGKSKPHVFKAIQSAMAERSTRTGVTADRVLLELARIGFADIRRIFAEGGGLQNPTGMTDEIAAAVQSVEVIVRQVPGEARRTEEVHKIKLNDKVAALTLLGRHLAMWKDKVELSVDMDLATCLEAAGRRADGLAARRAEGH